MGDTPFGGCEKLTIYCPKNSFAWEYAGLHNISRVAADKPIAVKEPISKANAKSTAEKADQTGDDYADIYDSADDEELSSGFDILEGKLYKYTGSDKIVCIPNGVKEIGCHVDENKIIEELTIPSSVKTIGFMAFSELSKLKKVFFENGVEVIGFNAFSKTSIEELVLPPSIKIIKSFAFYGTPITRVEIPDSVETIEDYAFSNDTVVCGNKGTAAEAYAKLGCSKFELYGNGDTTDETLVTKLEDYLIIDGRLLEYIGTDTEIALPNGIKVIGQSAFPNKRKLWKVKLNEDLEIIESSAFSGASFASIVIPDSVKRIESSAFQRCALKEVVLGKNLEFMGQGAFYECPIEGITIPQGVKMISGLMFCQSRIKKIVIPSSVKTIGEYAFSECKNLKEVVIEEGLEHIGESAFAETPLSKCNLV